LLDLLVYVLPFLSSPWLSPLLSVIASNLPLLLPFYLSTSSSFKLRSRELLSPLDLIRHHQQQSRFGSGCYGTQPPLTHNFLLIVCAVGSCLVRAPM
jgi:hypothetical protein